MHSRTPRRRPPWTPSTKGGWPRQPWWPRTPEPVPRLRKRRTSPLRMCPPFKRPSHPRLLLHLLRHPLPTCSKACCSKSIKSVCGTASSTTMPNALPAFNGNSTRPGCIWPSPRMRHGRPTLPKKQHSDNARNPCWTNSGNCRFVLFYFFLFVSRFLFYLFVRNSCVYDPFSSSLLILLLLLLLLLLVSGSGA